MEIIVWIAAKHEQYRKKESFKRFPFSKLLVILLISTFLLLAACDNSKTSQDIVTEDPLTEQVQSFKRMKNIEANHGWLSFDTILFSKKSKEGNQLMTWNIQTKMQSVFFQPTDKILSVSISPDKSHVLVSYATEEDKITIQILDSTGNPLYSVALPAYELTYEWNMEEPGLLIVSTFTENWSYTSYLLNAKEQTLEILDSPHPFAQWSDKNELMYLDWQPNDSGIDAPLVSTRLEGKNKESIMLDVVHFRKMKDYLMTIQVDTETLNRATYSFFDCDKNLIGQFSVPYLNNFSHAAIPAYDMNEKRKDILTFVPEKSDNLDQYKGDYALVKYNWKSGEQVTIFDHVENKPISCSPSGELCLYGHRLENVIDMNKKKIYSLFAPSE